MFLQNLPKDVLIIDLMISPELIIWTEPGSNLGISLLASQWRGIKKGKAHQMLSSLKCLSLYGKPSSIKIKRKEKKIYIYFQKRV